MDINKFEKEDFKFLINKIELGDDIIEIDFKFKE